MTNLEKYEAELAQIDAAISAILTGAQEYQIGSRRIRRGELPVLYKMKQDLERKINAASSSAVGGISGAYAATFDSR